MRKNILGRYGNNQSHWVGNGFPVRSLFSYNEFGEHISPFLLLDYAGPYDFSPTQDLRGVGEHPHKGFETVTIVYDGEVEHRDSAGAGGIIGPGDVQWMTAGNGIQHQEYHSEHYAKTGGPFRMVQLWVNLPAKYKSTEPAYQTIKALDIPRRALSNNAGAIRIIAGTYQGLKGPARVFSSLNVWDAMLNAGERITLSLPHGHTCLIVCLEGQLSINDSENIESAQFALLGTEGEEVNLLATIKSSFLILTGEPLKEPIAGYGPFVMNTKEEIRTALMDFKSGKFKNITN